MKTVLKILSLFVLTAASWVFSYAQVPYFQHILLLKKNEPVQVNKIFQDHTGFLWYGTNKGLFRFDGTSFRQYTHADSLPDENVTALAEDSTGRIWTGHRNGKLAYLEGDNFIKFDPQEGSPTNEISDILFDKRGTLWFSTLNDGLYYFIRNRIYRLDKDEGMPDLYIYDIAEDTRGNIWAGSDGGLITITITGSKTRINVFNYKNGLPDNIVKKIVPDENGALWIGTEDAGIIRYDPISDNFKPVITPWHYGTVTDFLVGENQFWISSLQSGLIVYDRVAKRVKLFNAHSGSGFTSIVSLLKDSEENIWAGTKSNLMLTRGDEIEFIDELSPTGNTNAVAVTVDKKGSIWYSNAEGLFKRTVDETGQVTFEQPLKNTAFSKYTVISLYTDSFGYIWVGLFGEGVIRLHPDKGLQRILFRELRNGNILNITGKGNDVWLATLGGGTKIHINGESLDIRNYTSQDGLIFDYIYQIFVDSQDRVWFATDGKGVDMMDQTGFHHYQAGLNSKVVYGFAEDSKHRIWVNVQGDGLYFLEGEKFIAFDPSHTRLRDDNISGFTSNPSGNLFILHDLGIDIYDIEKNRIQYLGDEAGIRDMKPNLNSLTRDNFGAVFAGTETGIIKYSEAVNKNIISPQPVIENLTVMNETISVSNHLTFSYNQNPITIHFVGLWYQNPSAINYQYQLENYDREWISTQNKSVIYSRLSPGTYRFRLKASESGDFSDLKETSFLITVSPPFWQTSWFYGASGAVIIFLSYSFIQFRERKLREDKQLLEAKVNERTEEINKKNIEIHKQAEEIRGINENLENLVRERTHELEKKNKTLEEYAFINAHELRAPVASILGLINLMQMSDKDEEGKIYVTHLKTSAEKLDKVVKEIGRTIEKGG